MKKEILVATVLLAANAQALEITGVSLLPETTVEALKTEIDAVTAAEKLMAAYHAAGYLTVEIVVAGDLLTVRELGYSVSGDFADYLAPGDSPLTAERVELATARMREVAAADGEAVLIQIGDSQGGPSVPVAANRQPLDDAERWGGSLGYSSWGSRYSGPDVFTLSGRGLLGSGVVATGSYSYAPDWRTEAEGGQYQAGQLALTHFGRWGATRVSVSANDYLYGGDYQPLEYGGNLLDASLYHSYRATAALTLGGGLRYVRDSVEFGLVGATDETRFVSALADVSYAADGFFGGLSLERGLWSDREVSFFPLAISGETHFTVATLDVGYRTPGTGWALDVRGGGQLAEGAHSANLMAIGGPGRGQSYASGFAVVEDGAYGSVAVRSPALAGFVGFAGVDGSRGSTVRDDSVSASSAFIGIDHDSEWLTLTAAVARRIGQPEQGNDDSWQFNATAAIRF